MSSAGTGAGRCPRGAPRGRLLSRSPTRGGVAPASAAWDESRGLRRLGWARADDGRATRPSRTCGSSRCWQLALEPREPFWGSTPDLPRKVGECVNYTLPKNRRKSITRARRGASACRGLCCQLEFLGERGRPLFPGEVPPARRVY